YQTNAQGKSWPAGSLMPNDLGLFDMLGNAWEWCQDAARPHGSSGDGKAIEDMEDPAEITNSTIRVFRGGAVNEPGPAVHSAHRNTVGPGYRAGFRLARTLPFRSFDRYAAARAAALAVAGQGKNQPPQGDASNAKLRRQALDWLKAELVAWSKVQPPRVFVARRMWQLQ